MAKRKKGKSKKMSKVEKELAQFKGKGHHSVSSSVRSISAKNAEVVVDASKVKLSKRKVHRSGGGQMDLPFKGKGIKVPSVPTLLDKPIGGFSGFDSAADYLKEMTLLGRS